MYLSQNRVGITPKQQDIVNQTQQRWNNLAQGTLDKSAPQSHSRRNYAKIKEAYGASFAANQNANT